ncbi:MAG: type VII secretion integral membrane protein EccD [Nocardioidaceae bacterium]|nr:type VII secretion integral membrane protein EccD [Nocardioidaceae bacterium]
MLTAYSRVTVVTTERTVDLALPSSLPIADVVPQVLRFCGPTAGADPVSWTLARLGGASLPLSQTLSDAGVLDGDLLELRSQNDDVRPAVVEDVRDAIEDSADAAGGAWGPRTTLTFVLLAGAAALAVLAGVLLVAPSLLDKDPGVEVTSAVVTTAALLGMVVWGARFAHAWVAQVCAGVAMLWGLVAGRLLADSAGAGAEVQLVAAVGLVAVVAGAARLLTPAATGHLAAAVVALVASVAISVGEVSSVDVGQLYRILPVLGILVVGVLPRLSLSVGGLASADYRVRHVGQMTMERLRARYRESNAILVGAIWGIAAGAGYCALQLTFSGRPWDRYLGAAVGVTALLRSRVFSRVQHMVALRVLGVLVLGMQLVRISRDVPGLDQWLTLLVVLAVALGVGVSTLTMSDITRARVKRTLNVVEFLSVVVLVVLLCGATGVFDRLGHLVER